MAEFLPTLEEALRVNGNNVPNALKAIEQELHRRRLRDR